MATSLQRQLAAIAANSTHQLDLKAQKGRHSKSLLFEPRDAASQSFDTIYQICYEGFEELCALDSRFTPFGRNIFSEQSKNEDRTQMTKKENEELDGVLESFLGLAGARLLLKPAMKAVEWLVRRFRLQEYNTEVVLLTFLPYHTSHIFPTLLSILPDQLPSSFRFLQPYKASLQSPPRNAILSAAVANQNFFSAFNTYVLKVATAKHHSAILLGFWASITAQAINGMIDTSRSGRDSIRKQREEDLLLRVLPILQSALSVRDVPELFLGACMIITILATKASLEDKTLDAMIEAVAGSWTEDTLAEGIMCLSVVAEEKQQLVLPITVTKAVLQNDDCFIQLISLAQSQRVGKLAAGVALGGIQLAYKRSDASTLSRVKRLLDANVLSEPQLLSVLEKLMSTLLRLRKYNDQGAVEQAIARILQTFAGDTEKVVLLKHAAQNATTSLLALQIVPLDAREGTEMEVDMPTLEGATPEDMDVDVQNDVEHLIQSLPALPERPTSFLDINLEGGIFQQYRQAFQACQSSKAKMKQLLSSPQFHKDEALERPELLSLLLRVWSSNSVDMTKATALYTSREILEDIGHLYKLLDLQNLFPYLLLALSDPVDMVRRAAAELCQTMCKVYDAAESAKPSDSKQSSEVALGGIYGPEMSNEHQLQQRSAAKFFNYLLRPAFEDSALHEDYLKRYIVDILNGERETTVGALNKTLRGEICLFLASHLASPTFPVHHVLLEILNGCGKISMQARSQYVVPFARRYVKLSKEELELNEEGLAISEMDKTVFESLTHRSADDIELLKDVAIGNVGSRQELVPLAFDRIRQLFALAKGAQTELAEWLLSLSTGKTSSHSLQSKDDALQTLRNTSLPTEVLVHLVDALPKVADLQEQPTSKKRRVSGNDASQLREIDHAKLQASLQDITLVLDLVETNSPEKHPQLLRGLFHCLSELHHFKTLLGSELVYNFHVLLGCILAVVDGLRTNSNAEVDRTVIRTDLIVECVRTTSSTQIHNTALLLVSSLASWAPELVLHCVMPLFTFMSSTLLRQSDSFSAHVTDQTVECIVPPLAASLKNKGKDLVVGASELLLSFTAAFEHVPLHRRAALFRHLVETLGPDETLFAVIAMLIERYGSEFNVGSFVADMTNEFSGSVGIKAARQYLDLVSDSLKPKRHLSDILLSFADKDVAEKGESQSTLLAGLATLLKNGVLRERLATQLAENSEQSRAIQSTYASLLGNTMQLNRELDTNTMLKTPANALLLSVLGLMPTRDFIDSSAQLMQTGSDETRKQVFRALEARVKESKAGDATTRQIFLDVLPNCSVFLQAEQPVVTRHAAISCIDQICEKYGKTDRDAVLVAAQHVSGEFALGSNEASLRVISTLCLASMVEILGDDCIPVLPNILAIVLSYIKDAMDPRAKHGYSPNQNLLAAAFALLNAILDHLPWMLADQYLDQALLMADEAASINGPKDTLHEFGGLVAKKIAPSQLFPAVQRTFSKVPKVGTSSYSGMRYHLDILHKTIQHLPKAAISQNARLVFTILLDAFDLRRTHYAQKEEESQRSDIFESVDKIALDVTLKLSDATFRPFYITLVEWATKDLTDNNKVEGQVLRLISLYSFSLTLFEQLTSIVTSYAGFILENASYLLRNPPLGSTWDLELLDLVLRTLSSSFNHDQDEFWQSPAHFDAIALPLIGQLARPKSKDTGSTEASLIDQVIITITDLAAAARSQEHLKTVNAAIITHMKSQDPSVRLAAVKTQRSLTERLGVDWLDLLPEMLPIISELHEDDVDDVERETLRWASEIEAITGESLGPMLA